MAYTKRDLEEAIMPCVSPIVWGMYLARQHQFNLPDVLEKAVINRFLHGYDKPGDEILREAYMDLHHRQGFFVFDKEEENV